jgi:dihydroxy-acid dehydratase
MSKKVTNAKPGSLCSQDWFNNPNKIDMVAFHLERLLANGWTLEDLQSGKPLIGIALTVAVDRL